MKTPLVSAIVLNYRQPQLTVKCVQSLLEQTVASKLEVIVVENHSHDDSIGVLRIAFAQNDRVRIVETRDNLGFGKGNNTGVECARGEYIYITNPDNDLERQGLEILINALKKEEKIGIIAPRLVHEDGSVRDSSRRFPRFSDVFIKRTFLHKFFHKRMQHYLRLDQDASVVQETDWVVGASLLLRRSLYEELGGFDPRFFLFFEDIDLCRRVRQSGKTVVYYPIVTASDQKKRLSEGGIGSLIFKKTGRAHILSAFSYFWKWR